MTKKLERIFRDRKLTSAEVVRDTEVRRLVEEEFPPAARSVSVGAGHLSQMLKNAMRACGKSPEQIARDAGVSQIVVSRFLAGDRDIRMATADKLAEAMGLRLTASA